MPFFGELTYRSDASTDFRAWWLERRGLAQGCGQKRWGFCLFVCLFVLHAFEHQITCARFRHEGVGVQKRFWCRWIGKVCGCAPVLNFLRLMPNGDITKCRIPKNGKNWGFSPPQDNTINRSRRNFAGKRISWVCQIWCAIADPWCSLTCQISSRSVYSVALCWWKPQFLPFFGLRHLVLSPIGSSLRKLNTGAQL